MSDAPMFHPELTLSDHLIEMHAIVGLVRTGAFEMTPDGWADMESRLKQCCELAVRNEIALDIACQAVPASPPYPGPTLSNQSIHDNAEFIARYQAIDERDRRADEKHREDMRARLQVIKGGAP